MSDETKFRLAGGPRDGKCVYIRGPVNIEIDRDDCDTEFVDELLPAIVQALNNSSHLGEAIHRARAAQDKRFADEQAEEDRLNAEDDDE